MSGQRRCAAKNKAGKRCRSWAILGSDNCKLHSHPGIAAEIGRRGGQRRKVQPLAAPGTVAPPETADEVRGMLAGTMAKVATGEVDLKRAYAMAYIGTSLLKAIEVSSLEARLTRLEHERELAAKPNPEA